MTVLCNPLDIPYRIQDLSVARLRRTVMREAADPSLIAFRGRFYLFPSVSGGFWHSTDLVSWQFVATPDLPVHDYAPDVREIDGHLVVCASRALRPCSFYRTADPLSGAWEKIEGSFRFFDPNLFQDDDGRVYLYWGSGPRKPLQGQELDRRTLQPIGAPVAVVAADPGTRGWERFGEDFDLSSRSVLTQKLQGSTYIEGAWMTKHEGTYYLQYAAPATQLNAYCDGYATADSPLGPFTYSPQSPFSSVPGGFMTAAGHGSTVQDGHGNWWHTATMRIAVHHMFERRIGLWPAGFDDDGVLFCNQEFADHPVVVPDGPADPWSLTGRQMLLSYRQPVHASSIEPGHGPELVVDEDARTWWVPADARPGHWVEVDLPDGATVSSVQVDLAEHDLRPPRPRWSETGQNLIWRRRIDLTEPAVEVLVQGTTDGTTWETLHDTRGGSLSRTHLFVELDEPRPLRRVRVTGYDQPYGSRLAVSGLRVFGLGAGDAPGQVTPRVRRTGPLNAAVVWDPQPRAHGYNVRYGLRPDKLYHCWQVRDRSELDLATLNAGHEYWVAVDAFDENGVTRGDPVHLPATAP